MKEIISAIGIIIFGIALAVICVWHYMTSDSDDMLLLMAACGAAAAALGVFSLIEGTRIGAWLAGMFTDDSDE